MSTDLGQSEFPRLEMFLAYDQLRVSTFAGFLAELGRITDDAAQSYGRIHNIKLADLPSLTIDSADTSNSIKLTLGEGWLPQISTDEEHDIVVSVPKKLGMPLLAGYLVLNSASTFLDLRNDYLDTQIKEVELQLKQSELNETSFGERGAMQRLQERSAAAVKPLLDDSDIRTFEVNGVDLVALYRREDEDELHVPE
jgi:hypothetical protein